MIKITQKGSFKNTEALLASLSKLDIRSILERYGQEGVRALSANTPQESGLTANSWYYEVIQKKNSWAIQWSNSNVVGGVPVAILLQYGHGTGTGGYIQGIDFINPALKPVFDKIAEDVWKVVKSA